MKRKSNERKPPDLRRHLNKGKIDVDQIKEEYKLGKPLIETLTIEVDRSEKNADFEASLFYLFSCTVMILLEVDMTLHRNFMPVFVVDKALIMRAYLCFNCCIITK